MPLSMDAVAAVEDALLRGEWTQALADSRSLLGARILQLHDNIHAVMTPEEERVLSVYLQAVFELELDDEVQTAETITRAFSPLPCGVAIQWSKFLMAMNRRPLAQQTLKELLTSYTLGGEEKFSAEQYAQAAQVLALQLLLQDEGIDAARQFVTTDKTLDDNAKLQLLRQIQAADVASRAATKDAMQTSAPSTEQSSCVADRQLNDDSPRLVGSGHIHEAEESDDSSSYVVIGGTAIALAVAAAGALRYREKIQECASSLMPAISKGLADAKYALFEA
ncbi:hypothetical protein BBJ29_004449 [Phytophthora kernoviae]|uniref:Uncharacterized protein n=1 Tax=Phytophthora kernoviae TaxID=325452 RepID=A0A3F2RN56_9STRA|nr:hypothetical protein BBJ29_004449 [Phytophthora kernoviae]RLN60919.1 hypothetical protein BBP00_00005709 [Phytophthora kernoviae]